MLLTYQIDQVASHIDYRPSAAVNAFNTARSMVVSLLNNDVWRLTGSEKSDVDVAIQLGVFDDSLVHITVSKIIMC